MRPKTVIFLTLLFLGLLYRLFFASLAYSTIIWDMQSYGNIAKNMLVDPFFVDCCQKAAGYPLFLAGIYRLFGVDNLAAVRVVQVFLDLVSAVLLFFIATRSFSREAAWTIFLLYLFHPFAVSFVGLQLPETITIFFLLLILWVVGNTRFDRRWGLWFWFGVLLGIMLSIRLSFYFFTFFAFGGFTLFLFRGRFRFLFPCVALVGFILVSLHSFTAYKVRFNRWSLVPPYTMGFPAALYKSFFMERYPELLIDYPSENRTSYAINLEYNTTHYSQNHAFRKKYTALFIEKVRSDWPQLIGNSLRNMVWLWDIRFLFTYQDPWYPADKLPIRILNIVGLVFCLYGMVVWARKKGKRWMQDGMILFTILLFSYVTVFFAPIANESRYAIPLYPIVLLWAGYGIDIIISKLRIIKLSN